MGASLLSGSAPFSCRLFLQHQGIGDYSQYPCPAGHYCLTREDEPVECPAGRYRNNTGATSADDCLQCPGGFQCSAATTDPQVRIHHTRQLYMIISENQSCGRLYEQKTGNIYTPFPVNCGIEHTRKLAPAPLARTRNILSQVETRVRQLMVNALHGEKSSRS